MDHDALSETQRQALEQLQALTNGGDVEVARSVLQSVDWDVQVRVVSVAQIPDTVVKLVLHCGFVCLVWTIVEIVDPAPMPFSSDVTERC